MTPADSDAKVNIGISHAGNDEYLVMMVASGAECNFHQITLAQARALSLEIIKQVYQAELLNAQNGKSRTSPGFSIQFRDHCYPAR